MLKLDVLYSAVSKSVSFVRLSGAEAGFRSMIHPSTALRATILLFLRQSYHRSLALGIFSLLIIVCAPAFSQEDSSQHAPPTDEFIISGGISIPTAPQNLTQYWNVGYNIGGGVETPLASSMRLVVTIDYSNLPLNTEKYAGAVGAGVQVKDGAVSIANIAAHAKYMFSPFSERVTPYVLAGAGFMRFTPGDITLANDTGYAVITPPAESALSLEFGAGIDFEMSDGENSLFLESKFTFGLTKGQLTSYIPIRGGIKFKF